ncbi:MAG: hypothetical protein DSY80_06560 [Desulfocapsa sp.]|nr:MAG: hypothetical protein DSY80_06560 [Desulfocapsa sp.]
MLRAHETCCTYVARNAIATDLVRREERGAVSLNLVVLNELWKWYADSVKWWRGVKVTINR